MGFIICWDKYAISVVIDTLHTDFILLPERSIQKSKSPRIALPEMQWSTNPDMTVTIEMKTNKIRKKLIDWYGAHRRRLPWRETTDPYAIWLSEAMLQQTQVATVIPYYHRFMERFPSIEHLAEADLQEVLKLWEGLGYYTRARNLHRTAGIVTSCHGGKLPDDPAALRALPGIGDYTAAAILSIAFGQAVPVVDGNVKRVLARLLEIDTPVNQNGSHGRFLEPAQTLICPRQPADFNQAIMELGALVCRPKNPACDRCPLADLCQANQHGSTTHFPTRIAPKKKPHRRLIYGVIFKKGKMLFGQRPEEGLLGGLWEFPSVAVDHDSVAIGEIEWALSAETGITVGVDRRLTRIRHAYTHFNLSADVYLCRYVAGRVRWQSAQSHRWVTLRQLRRLPSHKAIHKFLDLLGDAASKSDRS